MGTSKIEWTESTWNPVTGCSPVSAGCDNCYAKRMANRLRGRYGYPEDEPFRVTFHPDRLGEPLKWKKPRMVFVCSMGDLFHEDVPDEWIIKIFNAMATDILQPCIHTYQILTKRPERMAEFFKRNIGQGGPVIWPNIWLGVTAENQEMADKRIPVLLDIPAAVRFVSVEPMLGPVDLTDWNTTHPEILAESWADFEWPEWVPEEQRKHIQSFWGGGNYRNIKDWIKSSISNNAPGFGSIMGLDKRNWVVSKDNPNAIIKGRFLPCWNNIGRIIELNGKSHFCSFMSGVKYFANYLQKDGTYKKKLHWVICGGETGPKTRPIHPDWARELRDQCQTADVPFFFKQWGAWVEVEDNSENTHHDAGWVSLISRIDFIEWQKSYASGKYSKSPQELKKSGHVYMDKVGKKKAGRLLDGREWNEYPRPSAEKVEQ